MKKIKGKIISLLTVTSLIATGTALQFAEAVKESSTSEAITDYTAAEQNEGEEEQTYITGEVEDLRTRYSKTYEQSDGSMVAVVSAAPVHFYDEEKEAWEEYDNRLTYNEETENYESDENGSDMQVSLPKNIDEKSDIEVLSDGYTVSITPIDMSYSSSKKTNEKKNIKSSNEKSLKKYSLEDYVSDSVLDGKVEYTQDKSAKVEYIFSGSGLKENIILSEAPEENQTYSFRIKADGLTAKLKKDNSIKLLDSDNKAVFVIPAPYMYDENFEFSSEIKTTLKKEGTEYILIYAPDNAWLTDKDRAYPVTIDPTISTKNYNDKVVDTSVISAAPLDLASNPNLYAGAGANGSVKMETYINFIKLPSINKQWTISNANLNLKTASDKDNKINAYRITSEWKTSTVKANPPSIGSTILDVCSVPSKTDTWVYWDITNTVYDWYNGGANYGIKLSSPYATNNQSVFYSADAADSENVPYISIEYTTISSAQLENSRTIDIGRAGTATINDFSGNLMLSREDIGVDGNVMPVNISMIYNLNDITLSTFGLGFRTNYSQTILYKMDSGKNRYLEYVCEDGSTVYFDEDAETGEYTDRSGRGYTLTINGTSASDYSNVVITDANNYEYNFDKYGRLIKITDTNATAKPAIEIAYIGDYTKLYEIDYIKDGAGRKYEFNYTGGKLTDISYFGKKTSVIKKVEYQYSGSNVSKVTYPDGKSVSYSWKANSIISAQNTDGYHVEFEYNKYFTSLSKRVTAIKEYGSKGTKGGDISVEYTPYQTKYINNNSGDTETLVFSSDGDLISTYNSNGDVTVNEYAKSSELHSVNSLVNTYEHKQSETNLIKNGEFENGLSDWNIGSDIEQSWESIGHPGNNNSVKLIGSPDKVNVISNGYSGMSTGETFEVGGWAKANASPQNPFNITVTFYNAARIADVQTINFNPYCTDWQYAIKTFKMDKLYTHFIVSINYSNQINEAYFDGIVVYRSETEDNGVDVDIGTGYETGSEETIEPVTSIGSDGSVTTTEEKDGIKTVSIVDKYGNDLSNETIVDGVSLKENNEYSSSGNYLKSSSDSLGNKSSYGYDLSLGNLNYVTDGYGNTVKYTYDNLGNMVKMSQNISGLSNGELVEKLYSYDSGNRQSQITHNGFDYDFRYTEFGLLESIKAGNHILINYSYDNDGIVTKINYGNNQVIDYEYNDDKNKTSIMLNDKKLYNYNYDEFGNLISIKDNVSDRVTNYSKNSDGAKVIEETGDGIYHKLCSTENDKVEVIGKETKKTQTSSKDNLSRVYWSSSDNNYSTYLKTMDKFERISNESMYKTSYVSDGKEVESSKRVLYNKEYSYNSPDTNKTSERIGKITYTGGYDKTLRYGYDAYGNISEVNNIWYLYDEASQLTTEVDIKTGTGKDFVYDKGGNITEVRHFTNGEYGETDTFTYGDSKWKDLLTAYNGNEITYDEIGNPLTYYNGTEFSWTMGRRLKSALRSDGIKIAYTYNADGLRTSKTIRNVKFNYFWDEDKLTGQTFGENIMYFRYDGDTPIGFEYNGVEYYYITNLQGDIIAILDSSGNLVAEYEYDAWGNCKIIKDTNTIAYINPLRYRGYYYDSDTDMYYLQSRYYDANIGRFINSDGANKIADGEVNLFSYCENNPVNCIDPNGEELVIAFLVGAIVVASVAIVCTIVSSRTINQFYRDMAKVGEALQKAVIRTVNSYAAPFIGLATGFKSLSKSIAKSISKVRTRPRYRKRNELHHIVARTHRSAAPARGHLQLAGLNTSIRENLVWLKTGLHRRLHRNEYFGIVNRAVRGAYERGYKNGKEVYYIRNTLRHIGTALTAMSKACPF